MYNLILWTKVTGIKTTWWVVQDNYSYIIKLEIPGKASTDIVKMANEEIPKQPFFLYCTLSLTDIYGVSVDDFQIETDLRKIKYIKIRFFFFHHRTLVL